MVRLAVSTSTMRAQLLSPVGLRPWADSACTPADAGQGAAYGAGVGIGAGYFGAPVENRNGQSYERGRPPL
ncbi:MAG: hypothetical protein L6Q98_17505 [Anaerolineae bacterium]|nr:hypothetical protein [Anaerolineae bacterium]NUQ05245.1 hypothetical protein [Anaerolineae bacterium]